MGSSVVVVDCWWSLTLGVKMKGKGLSKWLEGINMFSTYLILSL